MDRKGIGKFHGLFSAVLGSLRKYASNCTLVDRISHFGDLLGTILLSVSERNLLELASLQNAVVFLVVVREVLYRLIFLNLIFILCF